MKNNSNFSEKLIRWYQKYCRDLPWRRTRDPYKIWISEIMLQQTTVSAVIPYYERWCKAFPTVESVAKAPLQKILKAWQGLGYYARAKNIHKSAEIICNRFHEKVPDTFDELRELPGFGPYTTGAVLSIAFDKRYPIIDANVRRVVMRQLALRGAADLTQDKKISEFLEGVMPHQQMSTFNQALMELGALVCRNQEVLCTVCPVSFNCRAYQKGIQETIPYSKKTEISLVNAAIAVIERKGKYFIQKRSSRGLFADLWEFPGGKIEAGESVTAALRREIKEELGRNVVGERFFMNVTHFYTQFKANLHVWKCRLDSYPPTDKTHKWVSLKNIRNYPMPSGSAKIVDKLLADGSTAQKT